MGDRANGVALAKVAAVIADPSRATMLLGMLDGRAWTATELAATAGIARSTATEHLHQLVASGLVEERRQGRHRYLRLADPQAAALIEQLASVTPMAAPAGSLREVEKDQRLRAARTCYDHLAGSLGVRLCDTFVDRGYVDVTASPRLTERGEAACARLGIESASRARTRRPQVLMCLDWTERRDHLAGVLGAAILRSFRDNGWVTSDPSSRAVRVTAAGRDALTERLEMSCEDRWTVGQQTRLTRGDEFG
ncbi:ArsR/SmtB family transcription factor [Microbacterium sp. ZW T5_56]|uniref:ArsR/SmtB family transcription factor n=1 Tax=Microbacterium sp. ZW T5_56 TaxID=3378081 RepID=UPI003853803C